MSDQAMEWRVLEDGVVLMHSATGDGEAMVRAFARRRGALHPESLVEVQCRPLPASPAWREAPERAAPSLLDPEPLPAAEG